MGRRLAVLILFAASAVADPPKARDTTTVEGIMIELYSSVTREPGQPFDWDRFRAVMLPGAVLLPQPRDLNGETRIFSVEALIAWSDSRWEPIIGTPRDHGFFERQLHLLVERYGDIAHAFSTYEEGWAEPRRVLNRGINSIQLVRREGRWYIVSIIWDEENPAGPLPKKYGGE